MTRIRKVFLLLIVLFMATNTNAQSRIIVAADGSGGYKTIRAAFESIPRNNKKPVTIFVKKGVYREKLVLDSGKTNVTLLGAGAFETIIQFNDHSGKVIKPGDTITTYTSQTIAIRGNDFRAENIAFENNAGFNAGQAVAMQVAADRVQFVRCRFLGNQDVLFTVGSGRRIYFEDCYIEGTTDFIFGDATAWFEGCHIHSKKNSHVTAASTPKEQAFGYVFHRCILTGDSSLRNVSLGRPWRPYSSVTYIRSYIDRHILPAGWNNWKNPANESTARYAEYGNFGPGANTVNRPGWIKQLSGTEASSITIKKVFRNWLPACYKSRSCDLTQ